MPRWSMRSGDGAKGRSAKTTERCNDPGPVLVIDPEDVEIQGGLMTEYALFNSLSKRSSGSVSLYSQPNSAGSSKLSRVSRLYRRIFKSSRSSSSSNFSDDDDTPSFYSFGDSTGSSLSLATMSSPPSPIEPPGPSESMLPYPQCTIPLTEIHKHTGIFYYRRPTPPHSRSQRAGPSSASSSNFIAKSPSSTCEPHEHAKAIQGPPAILIVPPEDPPAEVYLPSVWRQALRHSKSSISLSPSSPSLSPPPIQTCASTLADSGTKNLGRSTKFLHRMKAALTEGSMASIKGTTAELETTGGDGEPASLLISDSCILDHERLSVSWLDRETKTALAVREEKARKAREEAFRRTLEVTVNHYRAPIVGI